MKLLIVGPGALGCLLAGLLSKKSDITLLDHDPKRAQQLKNQGLSATGVSGKWSAKVAVITKAAEAGDVDLILLTVKAHATKDALLSLKDLLKKNIPLLTLQNGLGHTEIIKEFMDEKNVLIGATHQGVTLVGDGQIQHTGTGETLLGNWEGFVPAVARQTRELFNECGLETKISRNIKGVLWSKLIVNCGINAVSAIARLKNGELMGNEFSAEIIRGAVAEAAKVAKRGRVQLVYDDPLAKVEAVCESTAANLSSMLQDVLARKKTEIDFLNGVIVRQGRSYGIPTPVNQLLVHLIKAMESTYALAVSQK